MKRVFQVIVFLLMGFSLVACGQSVTGTVPPSATLVPSQTMTPLIVSTPTQSDVSSIPLPTAVFPDETNVPFPTPNPKIPTLIPTIDPKSVPELLRKEISIQTREGIHGHTIQRITGWDYGFREQPCYSYRWLDFNHLLFYPRTGQWNNIYREGGGREDLGSDPVVLNLTNGSFWLRPFGSTAISGTDTPEQNCNSVYASPDLGLIINQESYGSTFGPVKDAVTTYTFDGQQVAQYWGKILGVSPSGKKVLVDEDTVIDLSNNKTTDLAWHMNYDVGDSPTLYWSFDENRLYRCCYYYADLKTGESYNLDWSVLRAADGKPVKFPMHPHQYGQWVRNDNYFLIEWDYWTIIYGDPIPLFSPSEKKYYDIAEIAEIPASVVATSTSDVSPDGMYVWIKGYGEDGQYHGFLVNLVDFKTASYDKPIDDFKWSADSQFAWLSFYDSSDMYILATNKNTLTSFPSNPITIPSWRPSDHILAYLTKQNQTLALLDAKDMSVKEWKLASSFDSIFWSPDGNNIALLAKDGSLWQVDYPQMEKLEQLTEPMPAKDVSWSLDGKSIAFISDEDIYIVRVIK